MAIFCHPQINIIIYKNCIFMSNIEVPRHVSHAKSMDEINGCPRLPTPERLYYGEIAVNYAVDNEAISVKNSDDGITTFRPNTNIYVKNFKNSITTEDVCNVLSIGIVNKYQDFNISFMETSDDDEDFDLFDIIDYIRSTFYNVSNLHVMLNVVKSSKECKRTCFYVSSNKLQEIIGSSNNEDSDKLSNLSTIIGFYKSDEYFIAGDSDVINGIEINWDKTTKVMTVKYMSLENAYRMDGNDIF